MQTGITSRIVAVAVCAAAFAWGTSTARAYEYRVPIYIQDEDDINELLYSEDISEEERDRLVAIYRDPIDLNDADREELYNLPGLTYAMVDAIIERRDEKPLTRLTQLKKLAGIDADIISQMQPFVRIAPTGKAAPKGKDAFLSKVRMKAADRISEDDDNHPEGYMRAETRRADRKMQFGAAATLRNTIGQPSYYDVANGDMPVTVWKFNAGREPKTLGDGATPDTDVYERYLKTSGTTYMPSWPKVYAMFNTDAASGLAGSYRVGFGQRLVLDNTGNSNPHGFAPDLEIYEGDDGFSLSRGFFGAVGTVRKDVGRFDADATGFFSWWRYDVYQYDLHHDLPLGSKDDSESYKVLTSYKQGMYRQLSYVTLPQAYSETLGGGNVTLNFDKRTHVGITGYAAQTGFYLDDPDTVFARSSAYPQRDMFYAVGLDAAYGKDNVSLFSEVGMMDNQAFAGTVRGLVELDPIIFETSYRYYGFDYDNPHSRGYGMADEFEGDRDKGEQGIMLSAKYKVSKQLSLRVDEDIWQATAWASEKDKEIQGEKQYPWRMETYLRADVEPTSDLRLGAFVQLNDKDLSVTGREHVYGEDGERYQAGVQAASRFAKNTIVWLYYKLALEDASLGDAFQKSHYVTGKFSTRPLKMLGFAGRLKYLKGELEQLQGTTREHFLEGYLQLSAFVTPSIQIGLRGLVHQDILETDPTTAESLSFSEGIEQGKTIFYWKAMAEWAF